MRLRLRLPLLLILSVVCSRTQAAGFAGLEPGPFGVGLRVVQQYDYARGYQDKVDLVDGKPTLGERARPIQTLVWYPAQPGGAPLRYNDYLRTEASDDVFGRSEADIAAITGDLLKRTAASVGAAQAQRLADQAMWAVRDARAAAGTFPVVIYAPGVGSGAHGAADLCEYLASHGYVVLASRSLGTRTRAMNTDLEGVQTQARDIGFLLSYARALPQADLRHVAAAGWSWGGMSNVFAAAADNRISALVSLDGTREPELTKRIGVTQVALPWLYISRRPDTVPQLNKSGVDTSFSLLNELKYADVYQVAMYPMEHVDFSTEMLRFAGAGHFSEYTRPEVETAYRWSARYVLEFLNAFLKNDAAGLAFLNRAPVQNGVPPHVAMLQHTPPTPGPLPSRAGFAAALAEQGFDRAPELYRTLKARDPAFNVAVRDFNNWGYDLLYQKHDAPAAVAIFKLGTTLYPGVAYIQDSLAEAYEKIHDIPAAIASYRRAVELDPNSANAARRLKALQ